jgi:phosphoglycolate phosphatase
MTAPPGAPAPSGPRLVIFDMDGTLIDSQHEILGAMASAFALAGHVAPSREEVLSIVGLSLPQAMTALAPHLPETETLALVELYRQSFLAARDTDGSVVPLYPGALDVLLALSAEPWMLLGVATGKARRGLDRVFALHAIGGYFVTLQTADDHPSKPHPSMVEQALRETGCPPERAVMVGDTEFDIVMGRGAGVATVGVSWGYHPRERLIAAGADRVIDDIAELPDVLAELWQVGT